MSAFLADILNVAIKDKSLSYLELGCYIKYNFNNVNFNNKECVDIHAKFDPTYIMTTDNFFLQNKKRYDIIFIDANHDLPFVVNDYINSIKICNKMIVFHDMFPPNQLETASGYCSDSYKLLAHFKKNNIECFTLNCDCGLTFLFPKFPIIEYSNIEHISYDTLLSLNIEKYTKEEIINILDKNFNNLI